MQRLRHEFEQLLERTGQLLIECNIPQQALWFEQQLQKVKTNESNGGLINVAKEVRSTLVGMGSFSDLSVQPSSESGLSEGEANDIRWELVEQLDAITERILRSETPRDRQRACKSDQ